MPSPDQVLPTVTRLLAPNPGPMTLDGTNTWVLRVADHAPAVVVDPGPADEGHLSAVAGLGEVELIVLTHGHLDHAEGADRLRALTGAPVTALDEGLCRGAPPLRPDLATETAGVAWTAMSTPGHTSDSVCLLLPGERALLTGDTVLGRGTTVVAHPDGRLGDYLDSLHRIRDRTEHEIGVLLPGHGPIGENPLQMLDFYLHHREQRLAQVAAARAELGEAAGARQIVAAVYADVDRSVWPAAELSVMAQLQYLDEHAGAEAGGGQRRPDEQARPGS